MAETSTITPSREALVPPGGTSTATPAVDYSVRREALNPVTLSPAPLPVLLEGSIYVGGADGVVTGAQLGVEGHGRFLRNGRVTLFDIGVPWQLAPTCSARITLNRNQQSLTCGAVCKIGPRDKIAGIVHVMGGVDHQKELTGALQTGIGARVLLTETPHLIFAQLGYQFSTPIPGTEPVHVAALTFLTEIPSP